MLIPASVVPALLQAGITIHPTGPDTVELTHPDGTSPPARVHVQRRSAALSPSHLRRDLVTDHLLIVVPSASPAALRAADEAGVSVIATRATDHHPALGGHIVFPTGTVMLDPPAAVIEMPPPRRGKSPWGTFAVLRQILAGTAAGQVEMADLAGISQGRVSQTLSQAVERGLVRRVPGGGHARWVPNDWDELASWWSANYPGPGGFTTFWFGLSDVVQQARSVVDALARTGVRTAVSGDVAADVLAPWRRPGRAVLYADVLGGSRGLDLALADLTPAGADEATLELIVPEDRSVWGRATAGFILADGMQVLWDVARAPGSDTDQAVSALRRVLRPGAHDLP